MRYLIEHETQLSFAHPVVEHHCEVRLAPLDHAEQRVHSVQVEVEPSAQIFSYIDCYGNQVHHFGVVAPHESLVTRSRAEVETLLTNPFDYVPVPPDRERRWIDEVLRAQPRLWDFVLHRSAATPSNDALTAAGMNPPGYEAGAPLIDSVIAAREWIGTTLSYRRGVTHTHSALAEALAAGAGVCQDFAHLLITLVRGWDFPARYVMGYQDTGQPGSADASADHAPHAWAEVLIPGAGWRGFDAVSQLLAADTYVAVAVGRDALDAAPQRGSFKGLDEEQQPRVTLRMARQQQQ